MEERKQGTIYSLNTPSCLSISTYAWNSGFLVVNESEHIDSNYLEMDK